MSGDPIFVWNGIEWVPLGGGSRIISGWDVPTDDIGDIGDYYLDQWHNDLYGPKVIPVYSPKYNWPDVWSSYQQSETWWDPVDDYAYYGPKTDTRTPARIGDYYTADRDATIQGVRFNRHIDSHHTSRELILWVNEVAVASVTTQGESGEGWKEYQLPFTVDVLEDDDILVTYDEEGPSAYAEYDDDPTDAWMWLYDSLIGPIGEGYPANNDEWTWTYRTDVVFRETTTPSWSLAIRAERTDPTWIYDGEFTLENYPENPEMGHCYVIKSYKYGSNEVYDFRFHELDADGIDREEWFERSTSGDHLSFVAPYMADLYYKVVHSGSASRIKHHQYLWPLDDSWENGWHWAWQIELWHQGYDLIDDIAVGSPITFSMGRRVTRPQVAAGLDTRFYLGSHDQGTVYGPIAPGSLATDIDDWDIPTPLMACLAVTSMNTAGVPNTDVLNGLAAGDILVMHYAEYDNSNDTTYNGTVGSQGGMRLRVDGPPSNYGYKYYIPVTIPPWNTDRPTGNGDLVGLKQGRIYTDNQGGGFKGAWLSNVDYPQGSQVTYGGFLWATQYGGVRGTAPTDAALGADVSTNSPYPSNNVADAAEWRISRNTTGQVNSTYIDPRGYTMETGELQPISLQYMDKTMWIKYTPTVSGVMGVALQSTSMWTLGQMSMYRMRTPTFTGWTSLSFYWYTGWVMSPTTPASTFTKPISVQAGVTYYFQICGHYMASGEVIRAVLYNPKTTAPVNLWTKIGTIPV